jgi:hypothetical protein
VAASALRRSRIATRFTRVPHLPPPPTVQVVHVRERPLGVVVVREIASAARGDAPIRFAELAFQYGAHRVRFDEPGESIRREAGSERVEIHRRPNEEAELLPVLLGSGLLVDWIEVEDDPRRVFTMASDADWAMFLADGAARLREQGFAVDIDPCPCSSSA